MTNRIALMGHVIADYPSPSDVRAMINTMAAHGAKYIEIQIPFSEPMADGPTFLAANHAALHKGVGYADSLSLMREMTAKHPTVRFIFMSYLNPIFRRGYARFVNEAVAAGAAGVIVPDLPREYAADLNQAIAATGGTFDNITLIAPNVQDSRLDELAAAARGLIYAVARGGVTGSATDFGAVRAFIARIRSRTKVPIGVGFGVRSAADVRALAGIADYAIIGTASLKAFEAGGLPALTALWTELAGAAH